MPTEETRGSRWAAITDMMWFQKAEPTEIGGQGQFIPYDRLTQAERNKIEEGRARTGAGFDYGAHTAGYSDDPPGGDMGASYTDYQGAK